MNLVKEVTFSDPEDIGTIETALQQMSASLLEMGEDNEAVEVLIGRLYE